MSPRRRHVALPVTAGALVLLLLVPPLAAAAETIAPSVYGWWSQTSVAGTDPSGNVNVPPDGMLVQNGAAGPLAVSALQFSLPQGTAADTLTLDISGQAVITQPPEVCPATTTFTAAEGGSWSDAPGSDCSHPVSGVVNSAGTEVQFPVATLTNAGGLAVVVRAGGATDRIAFTKPGPSTLSETVAPPESSSGAFTPPPPVVAPNPAPPPPVPAPVVPASSSASSGVSALPPPSRPPAVAATGLAGTPRPPAAAGTLAGGVTLGVLLVAILYWTEGFGALRLRSSQASRRLKRRTG